MAARAGTEVSTPWLNRRGAAQEWVRCASAAWDTPRKAVKATVDWPLTTTKARRQRKHLDP